MKRIRRTPRGNRCDKSQDSQGILLFVLKRGKIAISRQPLMLLSMPARFASVLLRKTVRLVARFAKKLLFDFFVKPFANTIRYYVCTYRYHAKKYLFHIIITLLSWKYS